jgi:hypothetical protein
MLTRAKRTAAALAITFSAGLALAGVAGALAGCSTDRTVRESNCEGSWSPADVELFPGCSLTLENATTHERVAIEVADDGRVHAERATGGRLDAVDADLTDERDRLIGKDTVVTLARCRFALRGGL